MKKIIGLAVAAIAVMVLVAGGTFAYFSDTEKWAGNSISAGTLYLTGGSTAFFTANNTGISPSSSTQDEVVTLAPTNTTSVSDYLSIKISNLTSSAANFPTNKVHDINGNTITAGDFGKYAKVAIWLCTHAGSTPQAGDLELNVPGTLNGTVHTPTTLTTALTGSTLTYYVWDNYVANTSYTNADYCYWNNVLGASMGTTTWYLHATWQFPESSDSTSNNPYQGVSLASDFLFTLATINNPYN